MGKCISKLNCCGKKSHSTPRQSEIQNSRASRQQSRRERQIACPFCGQNFHAETEFNDFTGHILICVREEQQGSSSSSSNRSEGQTPFAVPPLYLKSSPYEKKILWFRDQMDKIRVPWHTEYVELQISREEFIESSKQMMMTYLPEDMHKEFKIQFTGEIAQDAGGLTKEWLTLLTKQLLSEEMGLFAMTNSKCNSYIIPVKVDEDDLDMYEFAGRVFAKALFDGVVINCPLSRIIFKNFISQDCSLDDVNFIDEDLYKSLVYIRDNTVDGIFFEEFVVTKLVNGEETDFMLKEDGDAIKLTDDNKKEYIDLRVEFETKEAFKAQLERLCKGFFDVIDQKYLVIFDPDELEFAMCGLPYIDTMDWKESTIYRGEFHKDHKVIKWFWSIIDEMDQEQLSLFLTFVTGSPRLPVEGFGSLKTMRGESARFTIEPLPFDTHPFPRAHTCFNRLDLPLCPSKKDLKRKLLYVLENHSAGFGLE